MGDRHGWKAAERALATALGVQRNPNTGRRCIDISAGKFAISSKKRKRVSSYLLTWLSEAERDAGAGRVAVLTITEASRGIKAKRIAIMAWDNFVKIARVYNRELAESMADQPSSDTLAPAIANSSYDDPALD